MSLRGTIRARSFAAAALASVFAAGCAFHGPPGVDVRLNRVKAAIGPDGAANGPRYLRYTVDLDDGGEWTREIIVAEGAYAERRTRNEDGARYSFGRDGDGAWIQVADDPVLTADGGDWDAEARTEAGLFGLGFTRPGDDDEAEYMGRTRTVWELAYRPDGGRTMTFQIGRGTDKPEGYDVVDDFGRLSRCEDLGWFAQHSVGPVLSSLRCSANDTFGRPGKILEQRFRLDSTRPLAPGNGPAWFHPGARQPPNQPAVAPSFPIQDARQIVVPVRFGDRPAQDFILDSGSTFTILTSDAAREAGVVPTGEVRLHFDPPWLAHTNLWVGVAPRMKIGDATIHGERVLVAESRHFMSGQGAAGLLGRDIFRRFVVDVDNPARVVRFRPRDGFVPDAGKTLLQAGSSDIPTVQGEVVGVDRGDLELDTGMPEDVLVNSYRMAIKHPRERDSDAFLSEQADSTHSPDYYSTIDGLRLGPFSLPKMDAIGRDRHREQASSGVALVGMGVMRYFRMAFDLRHGRIWLWPGDAYVALHRAGVDVEEGGEGPTIDRVVKGTTADLAGMKHGDVVLGIAPDLLKKPPTVDQVRRAIARTEASVIELWTRRRGRLRRVVLELEEAPGR